MQSVALKGFRLSIQQNRLWALQRGSLAYYIQYALKLEGELDPLLFQQAFKQAINRHTILRTRFQYLPDMEIPVQVILDYTAASCPVISLNGLSDVDQMAQYAAYFAALQHRPFDLEQDSPLQALLLQMAEHRHLLVLRLPSLCADPSTLKNFISDLHQIYRSLLDSTNMLDEPLQYTDVSAWQDELLQEEDAEEQIAFWRKRSLSLLDTIRLPFEQLTGENIGEQGAFAPQWLNVPLDAWLQQQLQHVARNFSISLEALLLACWQTLLWRLTDAAPSLLGVSCDGRPYEELSGTLGLYSRVVPLSVPLSPSLPFDRLLPLVQTALLEASEKQFYFSWPSTSQESERGPAFFPLSFEFEAWPAALNVGPLCISLLQRAGCWEPFALKLNALQVGDSLQLDLSIDPARVAPGQVEQLIELLPAWLAWLCQAPQVSLSAIPLLPASLQHRVRRLGTAPRQPIGTSLLHERFASQVRQSPLALAAICGEERLSYQQLNTRANQLAHLLRQRGVGANRVVALCLPRSLDQLVALLAVLKAGGAYAPLDPDHPSARLGWQLTDLQPHLLLTQEALVSRVAAWSGPRLCLDQLQEQLDAQPQTEPDVTVDPQDLAYLIWTSGSTGQPKAVMVPHQAVSNYTQALCVQLGVEAGWHFGTVSTLAADLGNTSIFCSLVSGGCLHILPYETLTSAQTLHHYLQVHPLDVLKIVPSHLSALLNQSHGLQLLPSRYLLLGGERLPAQLLARLRQEGGSCQLINHYGPTETTIGAVTNVLGVLKSAEQKMRAAEVPIGRAIANEQAYILDQYQHLLPLGVVGELYIGGAGVARGYHGRAEQTGERFVPDGWSEETGQRMYRTGDLARMGEDGQIEYMGRRDSQVKLRGYRIELGEIEVAVRRHANVRECVVLLREDEPGKERLVAYVVARQQPGPTGEELREFLGGQLPGYMLPAVFLGLRVLPLTSNGKIDWRQLPSPMEHEETRSTPYMPARNPTEEILVGIWEDVLKVKPIGIHDHFTNLGGHSLLATQIVSQVRVVLQVEIPLRSLFEAPTIIMLAERVEQVLHQDRGRQIPPLTRAQRTQELPLSFAQQRLWFLQQLQPDSSAYNVPIAARLRGALNVAMLQRSLQELLQRHENLRTTFPLHNGSPVQFIEAIPSCLLPLLDLRNLAPDQQAQEVRNLLHQEAGRPFDLARGPLVRSIVLRLSEEEHVLGVTMHHIISDGWSRSIMVREMAALYNALVLGQPSPLPALPIQYADFALWQRNWLQGEVLEEQIGYWQKQLAGLAPLDLPTDHPRPAVQTFRGGHQTLPLPPVLCDELRALSQREGVTLFMTVLAAFQVLLARYSGQSDIAVGAPIANRTHAEIEGLIGFFVNTLVLRTDLSDNPTFQELLSRVRETCLGAYAHQDVPFEKLVEVLRPQRDLSRSPLFQVALNLQQSPQPSSPQAFQGLLLDSILAENTAAKFDLTLSLMDGVQGMQCGVEYNVDLFEASTISHLLSHWQVLLTSIVADPRQRVVTLPLLSERERQHLLVDDWNVTQMDYPDQLCLHRFIEAQVEQTPDRLALAFEETYLTYDALNRRANQLAHTLLNFQVQPEMPVGILLPRSPEAIIAILAILKAGGAYLPLDPHHPQDRLAFIFEDAHISVLVTLRHLLPILPPHHAQTICLDTDWEVLTAQNSSNLSQNPSPDNLAYLIYTSGSTGRPKGVLISHRNVVHSTFARLSFYREPISRYLLLSPLTFDSSVAGIFWTLSQGGMLVLPQDQFQDDLPHLSTLIAHFQISHLLSVPSLYAFLLEQACLDHLCSLRTVIVAGEACTLPLSQLHHSLLPQVPFFNEYGPTEGTVWSSVYHDQALQANATHVPIGRPIPNVQIYLLDSALQPVPPGVSGELYIAGSGLARGYLHQAELTAEKFLPHPFSSSPGQRLYRTGDLARRLPEGTIEFLGRVDLQVKIRGYRIELGEIEVALTTLEEIQESAVVAQEETTGGNKRLVAYVVGRTAEGVPAPRELRAYLQGILPEYMIPSFFITLPALPLTSNGKLDRHALPASGWTRSTEQASYQAPRNPIEEIVTTIWSELLGLELVGIDDNFFELGGHSLLATQLISQLRAMLQVELPLRSLFEAPTVAGLAERIAQALRQGQYNELPHLQSAVRTQDLPLSFAQQRLWFLDQLEPASAAYNIHNAVRLQGNLDMAALFRSLAALIQRHESLHTIFQLKADQPVQIIAGVDAFSLPLVDLAALEPSHAEVMAHQMSFQEARQPFELAYGPLLRITLVRLRLDEYILFMTMHHIISDGWSMRIMVREVAALYNAFVMGQPSPLPTLPIQYADFALWQRNWLRGRVLDEQMSYWQKQLAGLTPLDLPTDHPRPAMQTFRGAQQRLLLSSELRDDLRTLSQREGVTLFMTLLAAFQVLLARYSGQSDIAIGTDIANRIRAEIEELIGFFVNTLVLRTDLSGNLSFQQLLTRVREVCLGAYAHQDVPFEKLVEVLQPERDLSRSPFFQVFLSVQQISHATQPSAMEGLTVSRLIAESAVAKFDLNFSIAETEQGLYCVMEYNTDLFESHTISQLLRHFHTLLTSCVHDPQERLTCLPLLNGAERHQLLIEWNANAANYPIHASMHTLFEEQVARTPERIAVACQEEQLSYDYLNRRVNQLAHQLVREGVASEVLVGLYLERSLDMLVSILAIFKAGGAYLPLDPMYPRERLEFILTDAQVQVLLTTRTLYATLPPSDATLLCLDDYWQLPSQLSQNPPADQSVGEQLAYVIYTSGSTGRPKGVMVQQAGMLNHLLAKIDTLHLHENDVVAQTASHCFDISVWQFLAGLLVGGCVQIIPDEVTHDPSYLLRTVVADHISILELVPSLLSLLLDEIELSGSALFLRWLIATGETVPAQLCRRWLQCYPDVPLLNAYGPTECSDDVTHAFIEQMPPVHESSIPIGRPIGNLQVYLLDEHLSPVPVGVTGQIYVGGVGVGRGYWQDHERTAETFLPDPYGQQVGGRLYRTGDLGSYQADGQIRFLGRIDEQVKIRGFRIELGEIKAVLSTHPQVTECVVIDWEMTAGDTHLVAYIVVRGYPEPSPAELQGYLRSKLPGYMIPSFFVLLEALPLTPNGKVDRRVLPVPETMEVISDKREMGARTPFEEVVQTIFQELLRREYISVDENFFEQGGHSLLATQVIARVRTVLQIELPLRSLFEAPTIAGLAQRAQQALREGQVVERPPLQPVAREGGLPLSFAQQRLWFLDQLEPESPAYNIPVAVRLQGPLESAVLFQSLKEVVRRHESLRTTFQFKDDQSVQVIGSCTDFTFSCVDLAELHPQQREMEVRRLQWQEGQQPFDLVCGPLLRSIVVRLSQDEYALFLTMHHIVSDGWSMNVFLREITTLYNAFAAGQPSPLPDLPIQYADFALWQRRWLQGEALEEQRRYWLERLSDLQPLELPADYARPAVQSYHGAQQSLLLPSSLLKELKQLSQREGVTLFMTLVAAFQILLYRYSGQSDLAIGTDIANRTHAETEDLIGFFVNTLVLRMDLSGNPTFQQLLRLVREVCLGAYAHQDLPFEKLVEVLHPQRDLSRSPLFQVFLSLQQASRTAQASTFHGLTLGNLATETAVAKFDLSLTLTETVRGLSCVMEYSTDLFEAQTISQLLRHFHALLIAIVQQPEERLVRLPLLSQEERHQLLVSWNTSAVASSSTTSLCTLFEQQAARSPERIALVYQEEHLTYAQLNRRANHLALLLRKQGVGTESLVGLYLERSPEMLLSILAIFKVGGAYVPLDPAYPSERLAFVIGEAHLSVLITKRHLRATLPATNLAQLCLEDCWQTAYSTLVREQGGSEEASLAAARTSTGGELAYVIYTSGSTGRPKGAMVQQAGMLNHLFGKIEALHLSEHDSVAQTASHCFDISVWQFLAGLLVGGKVHIIPDEEAHDPWQLWQRVVAEGLSILELVPPLLHLLLDTVEPGEQDGDELLALRWMLVTGEAVSTQMCRRWLHRFPPIPLLNAYGPTECSDDVTHALIEQVPSSRQSSVPIGYPLGNLQLYVLDAQLEPVPVGVAGQIMVGGVGVGRGYLQDPERTAAIFVPDPYGQQVGGRLYQTGDLGRYQADGQLQFLGRIDEQVKIRGFRIELGEIKAVLQSHEQISACEVIDWEMSPGDRRLVGYVVGREQQGVPSPTELRSYLSGKLPEYMLPSFFIALDALPHTPNGKLDRRALPAPHSTRTEDDEAFLAPRNTIEHVLAEVWTDVLHTSHPIGIRDNFFDLGGDSILGLQIIARARQHGLHLTIKHLFQHQTIEELSTVTDSSPLLQAEQGLVRGSFVLTPVQHWFFSQHLSNPHHWNQARFLEVPPDLDCPLLEQAISAWMSHHDVLRLRFQSHEAGWLQASTDPDTLIPFSLVDLSALPEAEQHSIAPTVIAAAQSSLNIFTGPLIRVVFFHLGGQRANLLFLVIHHLVVDGVSWRILLEDLLTAYEQLRQGQAVHLPVKTSSFQQWAQHLHVYAQSPALQDERAYWLADARMQVFPLPLDFPERRQANTEASARTVSISLSSEETRALLEDVIPVYHAQVNEIVLTALAHTLAQWTGGDSLLLDLEGHGRESLFAELDVSRTVGWFTSLFPLFLNLEGASNHVEELKAVKKHYRALPNHGIGYGIMRYLSTDDVLLQRLQAYPQAEVIFNYNGHFDQALAPRSLFGPAYLSTGLARSPHELRSHLLSINCSISKGQLWIAWEYSEHLHLRSTVEGLANRLVEVLSTLISCAQSPEDEDASPSDFPDVDLSQEELEQIFTELDLD